MPCMHLLIPNQSLNQITYSACIVVFPHKRKRDYRGPSECNKAILVNEVIGLQVTKRPYFMKTFLIEIQA